MNVAASDLATDTNGMRKFDQVAPIVASDEEIAAAVQDADLPALMAALATLTGDDRLLADDLQPPPPKMGASIKPQGGMSAEAQDKARRLAAEALVAYRDRGSPEPDPKAPLLNVPCDFSREGRGQNIFRC